MTPLCLFFLTITLAGFAFGQIRVFENGQPTLRGSDTGIHLDTPTRQKIDLAGTWSYSIDNETWAEVKVPSSFDFEGQIVFVRQFEITEALLRTSTFKVVALGINHDAEVYVNDIFVGKHIGGYTTIEYDIPEEALSVGSENVIKIIASNRLSPRSTVPLRKQIWGWKNYAGIVRDIYLLVMPKLSIDRCIVRSEVDRDLRQGVLTVRATLSSALSGGEGDTLSQRMRAGQVFLSVELLERFSGTTVAQSAPLAVDVRPNHDVEVQTSLNVSAPKLWSPEDPELYAVKTRVIAQEGRQTRVVDEVHHNIGFRRIELQGGEIVLNGRRVRLRGVLWHEDTPDFGASLTYEQMEKDIVLIRTMGANAVRFPYHPPHPYLLNLCSRYGLLALIELPAWNVPAEVLSHEAFQTIAEALAAEMVERDRHQASVLAWGIGDRLDTSDSGARAYIKRLTAAIRKMDARPVYFGSSVIADDVCTDLVDLAAINISTVDARAFKNALDRWQRKHPEQPVIVLRYGKTVEPNNRNGWSDPMSQEAQARFFEKTYAVIREAGIAGSFIGSFSDWRGDRPIMTVKHGEPTVYPMGLVSYAREKRAAYDMVRALYNNEKITALPIGRYRSTFPIAHIVWGLAVTFAMAYLYHYNRRFHETSRRAVSRSYNFFADLRDVHSVSVPQTIIVALAVSLTLALLVSGFLFHYRTSATADYLMTLVVSDQVKREIIKAAWDPMRGIVLFGGVFAMLNGVVSAVVRLFSLTVRTRVSWYHAFSIVSWGTLPVVFLTPLGMALFQLLQAEQYVLPAAALIALFLLWALLRILKGVAVVFDLSRWKAFGGGFLFILIVAGSLFLYYEAAHAITAHVSFVLYLMKGAV